MIRGQRRDDLITSSHRTSQVLGCCDLRISAAGLLRKLLSLYRCIPPPRPSHQHAYCQEGGQSIILFTRCLLPTIDDVFVNSVDFPRDPTDWFDGVID